MVDSVLIAQTDYRFQPIVGGRMLDDLTRRDDRPTGVRYGNAATTLAEIKREGPAHDPRAEIALVRAAASA